MDKVIDPQVTDLHRNVHTPHKACNLLWAPMFFQPLSHPIPQPLRSFVAFEGGSVPDGRRMLSHLGLVAVNSVPAQLAADLAVVATKDCCDLPLAFAGHA